MQYNLLFRWFVGLGVDDPVWVPTVFTKNRDRLLNKDTACKFLARDAVRQGRGAAVVERAFFGRRDTNRSLGLEVLAMTTDRNEPPATEMRGERLSRDLAQDARVFHDDALDDPIETILNEHTLEVFDIRQLGHNDLPV